MKRSLFRQLGGFNESLFPNEENELLNRAEKAGYQLVYHPGVLVFRPRRESFKDILKTFFRYGRGRSEQIRIEGFWQSLPLFLPVIFLFYLLSLFFYHPWFAFLPLLLYFSLGLGSSLGFAARRKKPFLAIFLPLLFFIVHLSYALGFLCGLATDLEKRQRLGRKAKIKVLRKKRFGQSWN